MTNTAADVIAATRVSTEKAIDKAVEQANGKTSTVKVEKAKTRTPEQLTEAAKKAPTSLHTHYAAWMQEKTGITFPEGTDVAKIVQMAVTMYSDFQASPENAARKAQESSNKTPKAPSKVKAELTAAQDEIARLKAELEAAQATPANGPQSATASGEASTKPVGRRTAAVKK